MGTGRVEKLMWWEPIGNKKRGGFIRTEGLTGDPEDDEPLGKEVKESKVGKWRVLKLE